MNTTLPLLRKTVYVETVDPAGGKVVFADTDLGGVAAAIVVSSTPVRAGAYNALAARLESLGITVISHHIEDTGPYSIGAVRAAVRDIDACLSMGDCLVLSFGPSHALTVVLCHLLYSGLTLEDATHEAAELRADPLLFDEDLGLLLEFQQMLGRAAGMRTGYAPRLDYAIELKRLGADTTGRTAAILDAIEISSRKRDVETVPGESPEEDSVSSEPVVFELPDRDEIEFERYIDEERAEYPNNGMESSVYDEGFIIDKPDIQPETSVMAAEEPPFAPPAEIPKKTAGVPLEPAIAAPGEAVPSEKPSRRGRRPARRKAVAQTRAFYSSLRFKLILIISLVITLSLSGMIFLATYFFKEDNKLRVEENNHKLSEVVALKARADIEALIREAGIIAGEIASGRGAAALDGSEDMLFAGWAVRGEKAGAFVSTVRNTSLMNRLQLMDAPLEAALGGLGGALERAFNGETVLMNVSPALNLPVLALVMPIDRDGGGRARYVLACLLNAENISKAFQSRGGITTVFMINESGEVIAHPDTSIVVAGANFIELPIVKMMMTSKIDNGQTRYRDEKGVFHIGSFRKIATGGLGVIATVEEQRAFEEVYRIQRRNIYIMVIVLTIVVMIIFYFGNTITTPIIDLVWATKKIKEGEYRVDIQPTTHDEIGELTASFIEMGRGLEEREKIKSAFGKFVNKEIAEAAMRGSLALGGERKTVAILFSDIRSFTAISERLQPEEVVEFLNQYMTRMVECVNATGGVVDKFIGDAIMAVWGTPVSRGNDTEDAVNCALMMRKSLMEFNADRGGPGRPVINIGLGINTGTVLAGQIGSEDRMEYTVIGDAVNLASRIESLSKPFGTDILISEESYELVRDIFDVVPMQKIRVKGKEAPQQIYAVLGRLDDAGRPSTIEELRARTGIAAPHESAAGAAAEILAGSEVKYEILES